MTRLSGGGGGGASFVPTAAYVGLVAGYNYTGTHVVAFDTVVSDPAGLWDATNFWFKVNAAGLWLVTCQLGGASILGTELIINGTAAITFGSVSLRQNAQLALLPLNLNDEVTFATTVGETPLGGSNQLTAPYGFACYAGIARMA
jgi:hypothetical protein